MTARSTLLLIGALSACSGSIGGAREGSAGGSGAAGNTAPRAPGGGAGARDGVGQGAGAAGDTSSPTLAAPRGVGEFTCAGASATPPPPRRLWRLTDAQYMNTVTVLFKGRRTAKTPAAPDGNGLVMQPPAPPSGVVVPLEAMGDVYRFGTYSGIHSISDFEFRRSASWARRR